MHVRCYYKLSFAKGQGPSSNLRNSKSFLILTLPHGHICNMAGEMKNKIDESLVKRFANGDMKAFDSIYSVFNQKLQKFVFTLIKTEPDTEDIV